MKDVSSGTVSFYPHSSPAFLEELQKGEVEADSKEFMVLFTNSSLEVVVCMILKTSGMEKL